MPPKHYFDKPALCAPNDVWKDGVHKENGETFYYTKKRRFVLRTTMDAIGSVPVWVFESVRPT